MKDPKVRRRFVCLMVLFTTLANAGLVAQTDSPPTEVAAVPLKIQPEMIEVKGGSFRMGSPFGVNENPQHMVTLTGFKISKTEITRSQYRAVMGSAPKQAEENDLLPVSKVSWLDAVKFCNALSRRDGLDPVYEISEKSVSFDLLKNGYRLPTEAEWEYAARGGETETPFHYAGSDVGKDVSWFDENSGRIAHLVGEKAPNPLGLVDMSGNLAEWCQDWYEAYSARSRTDPTGPPKSKFKLVRGGSFSQNENCGRVSFRTARDPKLGSADLGFRIVQR